MNIQDLLSGSIGQELINGLSQQTGTDTNKIGSAVSMALPFMLAQMKRNASSENGAENLAHALNKHEGSALNNVSSILNSANMADGLGILGHVFGSKQHQVANSISKGSGISTGNVMQILATLAPVVMAYLGKQKQQENLDSSGVSGLLENILGGVQQNNQREMSMIEKMLDSNGDGSIADEAMDLGSKLLGGFFK